MGLERTKEEKRVILFSDLDRILSLLPIYWLNCFRISKRSSLARTMKVGVTRPFTFEVLACGTDRVFPEPYIFDKIIYGLNRRTFLIEPSKS